MVSANKVIKLYQNAFDKPFPIAENDISEISGGLLDRKYIYKLYETRYEIYMEGSTSTSPEYEFLLNNLAKSDDPKVWVGYIKNDSLIFAVFLNENTDRMLGILGGPHTNSSL